jgi:hypothetical protein
MNEVRYIPPRRWRDRTPRRWRDRFAVRRRTGGRCDGRCCPNSAYANLLARVTERRVC